MKETHILVVEDHVPLLILIKEILEGEGYAVDTANTGKQALEIMQDAPADLIVSDIMMPGMDGFALHEAVRACPAGRASRSSS